MAEPRPQLGMIGRLASLALILEVALWLRVLAADVVQWYTQRKGTLCVFPDTNIYWALAGAIRDGAPYEILDWGDLPRFAVRTPGYPLFLAACRILFGDRVIAVRLVQAALGMLAVALVERLARRFANSEPPRAGWTMPRIAAALAALDPYLIVTSALVLSEAVFLPLMMAGLWGLAALWPQAGGAPFRVRTAVVLALATGAAWGAAILVRPSCALFVPAALAAWILFCGSGRRWPALRGAVLVTIGLAAVMSPWWIRNERIYGRFVPTALWMGASLYDGLSPQATGASDMDTFLAAPDIWPLDEETQDAVLRDRALAFAREHPGRSLRLAAVKLVRFWSPWPNAESFRAPLVNLVSALITIPQFVFLGLGLWDRRRDPRAWILLMGPLLYFSALHMVFASSMRYRIPAMMPAMVLVAIGIERVVGRSR